MASFCEQELAVKNFWFHHNQPAVFVTPEFGPPVLYPAWLSIQLIYHITALAFDGLKTSQHEGEPSWNYFLYLTNLAYLLLVLSNVIDLSITLYVHCLAKYLLEHREIDRADAEIVMRNRAVKISYKTMGRFYKMKGYLKLSWIFFTTSAVIGITVTVLAGTLASLRALSDAKLGFLCDSKCIDVKYDLLGSRIGEETNKFGTLAFSYINTVVILIHIFISAKPFRLLHFYLPVTVCAVYMIFSISYQRYTDNYIYKILDWNEVFRSAGVAYGVVFIVVPLVHVLVFGLVQARMSIGTSCRIRYSFSTWRKTRVRPVETEVDSDTKVLRWVNSNTSERPEVRGIVCEAISSSRTQGAGAEIASVKSETSL